MNFMPLNGGQSVSAAVAATSGAGPVLTGLIPGEGCDCLLNNIGTQVTYFRLDGGTVTVANGIPIPANGAMLISVVPGVSITTIAASTGSTLTATLGKGS